MQSFDKNAHRDALFNTVGASLETWGFDQAPPQPAIQSNQAHHSLHSLEGVALGDLVRLPRSQLFNQAHHSLHTLEGMALGDLVRLPRSQLFNRAHHSLHTLEGVAPGDLVRLPAASYSIQGTTPSTHKYHR